MVYVVVTTLPALFFFSTYAVLIGLWVEVSGAWRAVWRSARAAGAALASLHHPLHPNVHLRQRG